MNTSKTHFHRINGSWQTLFCSGRSVMYAFTTSRLDEVTCGACRRKLVAQSKRAA